MGQTKSKLCILALPAQSGKTRKAEEEIQYLNQTKRLLGEKDDINIWISANNQTLVTQTDTRIRKDLNAKTYSWMSSNKDKVSAEALFSRIITGKVDTVIMCAHKTRVAEHFAQLMAELNNYAHFVQKVNIWMDEADQFLSLWDNCTSIAHLPCVQHCVFITATPSTIVDKYTNINILPYEFTYGEHYRRLADCERVVLDHVGSSPALYLLDALEQHPEILSPGSRFFAPGSFEKKSHEEIAHILIEQGASILVLNGEHKEIRVPYLPDQSQQEQFRDEFVLDDENRYWVLDLKNHLSDRDKELNEIISKIYHKNQLNQYPFGVTGYMCVQRGITFQAPPGKRIIHFQTKATRPIHNGFLFDYAIIPNISKREEAYQTVSRAYGNIGNHPDYKPCVIVSTSANFQRFEHQEELVVNLARIAFQNKEPGNRMIEINKDHLKMAAFEASEQNRFGLTQLFDDEKAVESFLDDHIICGKTTNYTLFAGNTIQYRGKTIPLHIFESEETFRINSAIYGGISKEKENYTKNDTVARCMPVLLGDEVKWIGIYSKSAFNL